MMYGATSQCWAVEVSACPLRGEAGNEMNRGWFQIVISAQKKTRQNKMGVGGLERVDRDVFSQEATDISWS